MAIFSETHVDAYFIDGKKNQIEVIYKNASGQNIPYNIPVNWSHPDFQELIKLYPLESLERKWENAIKKRKNVSQDQVQQAIEKRVEQQTEPVIDANEVLRFLEENSKEMKYLFPFKVKVLELSVIKNADQETKTKIQKAKNMYSVIGIVGEVISGE
tara:strand:+ start:570 stop:1040 length:471 start_codon:yes stop_codon:yes gene_type:complete